MTLARRGVREGGVVPRRGRERVHTTTQWSGTHGSPRNPAAIDRNGDAGDGARLVAGQIDDRPGDVFDLVERDAARRALTQKATMRIAFRCAPFERIVDRRLDRARCDAVDG